VDKRISTFAAMLQMGATIYDLEEVELCYAPPFGSAKDPVNFAGMVAADVLKGDMPLCHWDTAKDGFLLDVREPIELAVENVPEAVHIPIGQLRTRLGELPRDARSMSFAVPVNAPTLRPGCFCRKDSKRRLCREGCFRWRTITCLDNDRGSYVNDIFDDPA